MRAIGLLSLIWVAGLVGCVGDDLGAADGGATAADGGAAVRDGGPARADGGSPDSGSPDGAAPADAALPDADAAPTFVWRAHAPSGEPREQHASFGYASAAGAWMYVAGGATETTTSASVLRASVDEAGAPGAWSEVGRLLAARAGLAVAVVDQHVVLAGAEVVLLTLGERGEVVRTATATPLPRARSHASGAALGRRVFVAGGAAADGTVLDDVLTATIGADGALSSWRSAGALPAPITLGSMIAVDGRLYLVGGSEGEHTYDGVASATVAPDGTLGAWRAEALLPESATTVALLVHGGALYALGGRTGGHHAPAEISRKILRASIGADGLLGVWSEAGEPLPAPRHYLGQAVVLRGHVLLYGGRAEDGRATDTVWSAELPQ